MSALLYFIQYPSYVPASRIIFIKVYTFLAGHDSGYIALVLAIDIHD